MTDPLLRFYEQELTFVRRALGQFGQDHPAHAKSLNIHQGQIEDPSMARLLDGVALLNANVEKQLSEQLPEVIDGLLSVLYPSYSQVVPSIVYLELNKEQANTETATLPRNAQFVGFSNEKERTFSTVDKLEITPFSLIDVNAISAPFNFNRPSHAAHTTAAIQLTLSTGDPDLHFSHLDCKDLDFFVQGFEKNADSLVELLLANTAAISISDEESGQHYPIDSQQLKSRISDLEFRFLPERGNQFSGYQSMAEFFYFKEKRQFFRLKGFGDHSRKLATSTLKINLFMTSLPTEFVRLFNKDVFKLNVVPAINLFRQMGEPISYDQRQLTIPVNADAHSDDTIDVVDVMEVYEITPSGEKALIPLFKDKYANNKSYDYWQCKRDLNDGLHLAITLSNQPSIEFNKLYGTRLLCSNGKQACDIGAQLECLESIDLPGSFSVIYPPSAPIEREKDQNLHWQFIGLLNCNFTSLLQAKHPEEALKQMLKLCSRNQISATEIQMIHAVKFKSLVSALRVLGKNVFSPGTEIEITLDTTSPYMAFCDVLNRFFQQFCSFDRYVQLKIRIYGRDGIVKQYPKIHGSQSCL
ncbi:type VI secretion system baseplate subunit TssF [Vibrio tapetis]|uniref:Protein ImpG/VasA n=1 Tax=Vibrio tapetis subsp. tapetis TaxID=1671868 RepID=A0A2N8ZJQ7_9VIBR|nr:type VI secretion system baseplate subunit TssF [Vibrio tapetis]SON52138.1 conserved protein of unknown function [Vibrio tapetis subsp. tapetis]